MALPVPYILMIGCFDTKGEVFFYLREQLIAQGERVVAINTGVVGSTDLFPVDIGADLVAQEADHTLSELRTKGDRGYAVEVMGRGAAKIVSFLISEGGIKAAIGMGGGGGTFIVLSAMKPIPMGVPKLCISTLAANDLTRQIGSKDILLMPSVVDVAGLNSIIKMLICQAAVAISAISNLSVPEDEPHRGRIAISMFGNTTSCVNQCTCLLQKEGYEVFAFHANGQGGRTMEALIEDNYFDGVLDITTTELADDLFGGICSAGPERMDAAARKGIPQVVVPGCMDMVNFGPMDSVPGQYSQRQLYSWAPDVTLMRTNATENQAIGKTLSNKINGATGPVVVLLPLKGLSEMDAEGKAFFQPEVNELLFAVLREKIREAVEIREVSANINEPIFAEIAVHSLLKMLNEKNT